jgi:transposase
MQISTIGLDLTKNVFQVHGVDVSGNVTITKKLRRSQVLAVEPGSVRSQGSLKRHARHPAPVDQQGPFYH